jgi:G:T-mismatch repair DNA endonuclease (very short patch repair protein)
MSEPEKKTRANVPAPKSNRKFMPETINRGRAADNMNADRLAPMTFNMPRDWHTEFKTSAVLHGMSMKDLLIECFEAWKREKDRGR